MPEPLMHFRQTVVSVSVMLGAISPAVLAAQQTPATAGGEVRQIVTFLF